MRTLIVGEAPSSRTSGGSKKRIGELAGHPAEDWATWINLLDEWPGPRGKGSGWNQAAAARRVSSLDFSAYDAVVLLGRRVAGAVLPGGAGVPWFRWIERGDGVRFAVVPHPSGIVRWWNDDANRERARQFLHPLALAGRKEHHMSTTATEPAVEVAGVEFKSIHDQLLKRAKQAVRGADLVVTTGYTRVKHGDRTVVLIHHPTKRSVRVETPKTQTHPIGDYENLYVKSTEQLEGAFARIDACAAEAKEAAKASGKREARPDTKPNARRKEPVAA